MTKTLPNRHRGCSIGAKETAPRGAQTPCAGGLDATKERLMNIVPESTATPTEVGVI